MKCFYFYSLDQNTKRSSKFFTLIVPNRTEFFSTETLSRKLQTIIYFRFLFKNVKIFPTMFNREPHRTKNKNVPCFMIKNARNLTKLKDFFYRKHIRSPLFCTNTGTVLWYGYGLRFFIKTKNCTVDFAHFR